MDVQQPTFSLQTCQVHTAAKHVSWKVSFKITLWNRHVYNWHMFTIYTYVKGSKFQKINFIFKSTWTVYGK